MVGGNSQGVQEAVKRGSVGSINECLKSLKRLKS